MKHDRLIFITLAALVVVGLFLLPHKTIKKTTSELPLYVAMGDSVAAGLGLESASDSSACGRTNESYPSLAAPMLNMQLKSYACSGATLMNGILGVQTVNNFAVTAQIDKTLESKAPKLITLTIGANDIGWTDILGRCITATCGTDSDSSEVETKLMSVKKNLQEVLKKIHDRYQKTQPTLMITGYYHVFPDTNDCSTIPGIDPQEQEWWNAQGDKLDLTIADATSGYSFVNFAPINFSGHDMCSQTTWIQGLDGRAPFHPNDKGQKVIAETITRTYEALKK